MIFRFTVSLNPLAHVTDLTKCLFLNDKPRMVEKQKFYVIKRSMKFCDANVDNIVIQRLVKTKTNSLSKPLVWIMSKMINYGKTLKRRKKRKKQIDFFPYRRWEAIRKF